MKDKPVIMIDQREKLPWKFDSPTESALLQTADYSIRGLEHRIAIERKSLDDLLGCVGRNRERFTRELERLQGIQCRCVVVESSLEDIRAGSWRPQITPAQTVGSIASWMAKFNVCFFLAGNRDLAARFAERFLVNAARTLASEYEAAVEFLEVAGGRDG